MTKQQNPAFWVGSIPIYGDVILSPMDGYSDLPFRSICRQLGSAMSYTEFVNALDVLTCHPDLERRLAYLPEERPVVFQLFDHDPDRLVEAAVILQERSPDIIDVNMGCSAKNISGRGAGAGLLQTPGKIAEIFRKLTAALEIPVTGKIRLGWDADSLNYLEIARIIEDNGGSLVAVHARTKEQGYAGQADWEAIAEIKQAVSIPVLGNGDIKTAADIDRMQAATGCDGVMVARAAIGNPWIFDRQERQDVTEGQVGEMISGHLNAMLDFYGPGYGLLLFRKHVKQYISPLGVSRELRVRILTSETPEDFLALLDEVIDSKVIA